MQKVWTDRSRIETYQRCKRLRWLEYHEEGMGIVSSRKPLPLAVGGAVHAGLAVLLESGQRAWADPKSRETKLVWEDIEETAVGIALADFNAQTVEVDSYEQNEQAKAVAATEQDKELQAMAQAALKKGRSDFDEYLRREQSALVEGLVRAYARRRLRKLLEEFEVLEVEREGGWLLHESESPMGVERYGPKWELWFASRPDALLRERATSQLYIISFKTTGKWDYRKEKDAQRDMQGLSEGVDIEKRLGEWWQWANSKPTQDKAPSGWDEISQATHKFLTSIPAPPRILGIRYEYMMKGERKEDELLSQTLGITVRSQRSPLTWAYQNQGMAAGDEQWNVSWKYVKEDGSESKLYYKTWKGAPIWAAIDTKSWVDKLDQMAETHGEENRPMGYSGPAQVTGFLASHPLDDIFLPPIVVYRNDDDLRDWFEETEAQEVEVAQHVAEVRAAGDPGEKRSLLNRLFPKTRRACEYPTTCAMVPLCFGGAEIREAPLSSGLYTIRTPNHPQEEK